MERRGATVVLSSDDLVPGPIDIPELNELGYTVEFVAASDVPSGRATRLPKFQIPDDIAPEIRDQVEESFAAANDLSTRLANEGVAIRSDLHDLVVFPQGSGGTTSRCEDGWHYAVWAGEASNVEIQIPVAVAALTAMRADPGGTAARDPLVQRPEPRWEASLATIDHIEAHLRTNAAPHRSDDRPTEFCDKLRIAIERRRAAWPRPHDLDVDQLRSVRDIEEIAGPLALLDAVTSLASDHGPIVEPFVPAVRAETLRGFWFGELPIGLSHMHGAPHLPADFEWPTWDCPGYEPGNIEASWPHVTPGGEGPLTFVAQFNLAEAPLHHTWEGPTDGWLAFFVDFDRLTESDDWTRGMHLPGAHRVYYFPAGTELEEVIPHWDHPNYGQWGRKDKDSPEADYIGYGRQAWLIYEPVNVADEAAIERSLIYSGALDPTDREVVQSALHEASRGSWHWIGGAPNACQDDPLGEALLALDIPGEDLERERSEWTQLFQLASDTRTDTIWGDMGLLHVFIRTEDLAAHRFDRTLLTFQCS